METIREACKHEEGGNGFGGFCRITAKYCKDPKTCVGFALPEKELKRRAKRELKKIRNNIHKNDLNVNESIFDKNWEWDELKTLHDLFVGVSRNPRSKEWLETCLEAQEVLGRTSNSILWHWEYIFIQDGVDGFDYNREGKVMIEFRQTVPQEERGIEPEHIIGIERAKESRVSA